MYSVASFLFSAGRRSSLQGQVLWVYRGQPDGSMQGWDGPFEALASVFFVEKGGLDLELADGRKIACRSGDLFIGRQSTRRQRIEPGTRLLSVGYDLLWPNGSPVYDRGLDLLVEAGVCECEPACGRLRTASKALLRALHPERREIDFFTETHLPPPAAEMGIRHQIAFWSWFERLQEVLTCHGIRPSYPEARSDVVREVKALLDRMPLATPFRGAPAELVLPVSWRRVQQLFRDELHETPQTYFDARRMEHARRRLRMPGVSIKEVASELGFRSLSHFSDWFKKSSGLSPRHFLMGP